MTLEAATRPDFLTKLTAKDIRTDVGWTAALISHQVMLSIEMLAEAEVCDRDTPVTSVENHVPKFQITMNNVLLQANTVCS